MANSSAHCLRDWEIIYCLWGFFCLPINWVRLIPNFPGLLWRSSRYSVIQLTCFSAHGTYYMMVGMFPPNDAMLMQVFSLPAELYHTFRTNWVLTVPGRTPNAKKLAGTVPSSRQCSHFNTPNFLWAKTQSLSAMHIDMTMGAEMLVPFCAWFTWKVYSLVAKRSRSSSELEGRQSTQYSREWKRQANHVCGVYIQAGILWNDRWVQIPSTGRTLISRL